MNLTPANLRLDLKCGRGAISEGEKCSKGAAQRTQTLRTAAKVAGAAALVGAGLIAGKALANKATSISNNVASRNKARMREMSATRQRKWSAVWGTNKQVNEAGLFQRGRAQENYQLARDRLYETMSAQRRELNQMKRFAPKSAARKRAARRGRRDSIWATGFTPWP